MLQAHLHISVLAPK